MATDFRALAWQGADVATAQATAPAGFTQGKAYAIKSAAIDNTTGIVWALIVNDSLNVQAVQLPTTGAGPFTFQ